MAKKLSRQQRRKLERVEKKGLPVPDSADALASEDAHATISRSNPAANPNNSHANKVMQSASNLINEHQYKPSSLSPCYLIEDGETKSIWQGGWVPFNSCVQIANQKIEGGVYIGTPSTENLKPEIKQRAELISINPDLDIIDFEHGSKYKMISDDLAYANMTPSDRGNYLEFLATGACDQDFDIKYMLLYFVELEFRYFLEKRNQLTREDMNQFMDEIDYLMTLYYPNPIMPQFELFKRVIFHDQVQIDLLDTGSTSEEGNPFLISAIGGGLLVMGDEPLKHYHVVQLFNRFPENEIVNAREAVCYVFDRLFESKFNQQYPNGLKIDPPSEVLTKLYRSLCQTFSILEPIVIAGRELPDIYESKKLQSVAHEIGHAVAQELADYINEIQNNTKNIISKKEIVFLADGGTNEIKNKADEFIENWILERIEQEEPITYGEILSLVRTESSVHAIAEHWYKALVSFHRVGYGLAPDLMLFLARDSLDEEVILFKYSTDFNDRTKSSGNFNTELFSLAIGFVLMYEPGEISEKVLNILKQRFDKVQELTESEIERLLANFQRMLIVPLSFVIFEFINTLDHEVNSEVIRESIKFYSEQYPLIISERLKNIFYIYQVFKLDVRSIKTDLQLTGAAYQEYQELLIELKREKKKRKRGT